MILSRKKISKLLNTNNQSNKRFKKRGINKKNGRTFRNKRKDINLRTKSLKHRRSKNKNLLTNYYDNSSSDDEDIKGGAVSGADTDAGPDAGPETDVPSQKTQEIDIISANAEEGKVYLTITDTMTWDSKKEKLLLLQDKINTYMNFIQSGKLVELHPQTKSLKPVVALATSEQPDSQGLAFLEQVKQLMDKVDVEFKWKLMVKRGV